MKIAKAKSQKPLFIVWKSKYKTGIDIIDEQHRGLVSLINTFYFHKADASGDINTFLVPVADMLKSYAHLYYLTLERLLRQTAYLGAEEQIALHKDILRRLEWEDHLRRSERDADGLLVYLKDTWNVFLNNPEPDYIRHLKEHYELI